MLANLGSGSNLQSRTRVLTSCAQPTDQGSTDGHQAARDGRRDPADRRGSSRDQPDRREVVTTALLAQELAELRPEELDGYCLEHPRADKFKPYRNKPLYPPDMERLAAVILQHESLGDALARIERYKGAA